MAAPYPLLAVRGTQGVRLRRPTAPPEEEEEEASRIQYPISPSKFSKVCIFSQDGSLFAWCDGKCVSVLETRTGKVLHIIQKPKTTALSFSPRGSYLATWETYIVTKDVPPGTANFHLWHVKSGELVTSFVHKKLANWMPQWSEDETICSRDVNNEVMFYEVPNFKQAANRLILEKVSNCFISPGESPFKIAAYVPGSKGAPSFVRMFKYPNLNAVGAAIANKSFFKADRADVLWNKKGSAVLIITSTEVDSTGGSYYGEQGLHYLAVNGESSGVALGKKGPIYSVDWNNNSTEFCAVYGFMPAKATLFNLKCEPIFDFGTGPRNSVFFNPQGTILCIAGFGNLRGNMEFWDRSKFKLISKPQASDSTFFQWCPDGEHVVTATCAPRLRQDNGFKIWHYSGEMKKSSSISAGEELWEVGWQPFPPGVFAAKPIIQATVSVAQVEAAKPAVYRPPGARGLPPTKKLSELEPAQNMKKNAVDESNLSKSALKNKRKREAKAKAKEQQIQDSALASRSSDQRDAIAMTNYIVGGSYSQQQPTSGDDAEKEKKIKALNKKLKAIEKLKEQQKDGKELEKNQLEKLKTEENLLSELQQLQLS
ncbi:eukaryotic translation initiation factor 2A-like [Anneissia japonica]|uniref:eukaryotic translation initiation factor 2A-like n=1 Tax=Anneissia japonica TaxID=1529436 RepID=UPI0014257018|nr:eukaryotic translation initiation factor 2A-like [Anneissia japonica]